MGKRENRAEAQERRKGGEFASGYSDEKRYELVAAVTKEIDPIEPTSVTQRRFDKEAPRIAKERDWPTPPTAHAITMRLRKSWQLIKEEATGDRTIQQVLARSDGVKMAPWLDESFVFFAIKRVHMHFQKNQNDTLYPHEYVRGRIEMIAAARRRGDEEAVAAQLPTLGQIIALYDDDWNEALRLSGLPEAVRTHQALPPVTLAEHFYETKERLPRTVKELREHATALKLAFPHRRGPERLRPEIKSILEELVADRASRGLETAADGPTDGARLTPEQIDALLAGALSTKPRREWSKLDDVIGAFAEFVEEFDGIQKITSALYTGHRAERSWPSNTAWQAHGLHFQEMVELGRERVRERRKKAA